MRRALMYTARTFLSNKPNLEELVRDECVAMEEDEGDEEEEEEEEEEAEEEGEEEGEEPCPEDVQLCKHVDAVVERWHLWNPEDPVYSMLKRAIDACS